MHSWMMDTFPLHRLEQSNWLTGDWGLAEELALAQGRELDRQPFPYR